MNMQPGHLNSTHCKNKRYLCIVSILILFCGFFFNSWQVVEKQWFLSHQRDSESLVMGRMVKSRQDGIFSASGLAGMGSMTGHHPKWFSPRQPSAQYFSYLNGLTFDDYLPNMSQIGGQGMLFSLLDGITPLSPPIKLKAFHMFTSLLSATALALVILWFYCEFGVSIAIFVGCSMVFSQWLTVFGRNLFWGIYAFYLPMLAVMWAFRTKTKIAHQGFTLMGILIFITVFAKCLINGYEYITTTLIMMLTPFIYYCLLYRLGVGRFLKGTLVAVFSSGLAILISLTLLSFQISTLKGDGLSGFEHVIYSLKKRTHGNPDDFSIDYAASLKSSLREVTIGYLNGSFLEIKTNLVTSNSSVSRHRLKIRYSHLIFLFFLMSMFLLFRMTKNVPKNEQQRNLALILATWFSILAPLSWFIVFKAHSFVHMHMNFIVWQMPFTFFGFAVCGLVAKNLSSELVRPSG